jgi:purine-binding chemotaxis protein CheW
MSLVIEAAPPRTQPDPSDVLAVGTAATTTGPGTREFLAFKIGREEYGIDILRVQEIRSYEKPTHIANAPAFIKGVINLRGVIVPVLDMRLKFNLDDVRSDGTTALIVLNLHSRTVAIVVDSVSDVITLSPQQMRPVPEFSALVPTEHLLAIGSVDDRALILVDIVKLMSGADMGLIHQKSISPQAGS